MNDLRANGMQGLQIVSCLVVTIWLAHVVNHLTGMQLNRFGIFPRNPDALAGVLAWPFLHGGLGHLVMNTTPLLFLGFLVSLRGPRVFFITTLIVTILGGLGVWAFGRPAFHIGASGLVFGYFGCLVAFAWYERSLVSFAIASIVLFYYGGMILGVIPVNTFVSWEGHLFGLLAGILAARLTTPSTGSGTRELT